MPTGQTVRELLEAGGRLLADAGVDAPAREAAWLMAHLLGTGPASVALRGSERLGAGQLDTWHAWLRRRADREPPQYITGTQEFHGLAFDVAPGVLVPRPETEGLVDAALALGLPAGARVADLGCGSGCVAVSLAVRSPRLALFAIDRSEAARAATRRNAERHGVENRIRIVEGDFADPPPAWHGTMRAVISNPPYVAEAEWARLQPEVRDHEPREALVPGPTGLEAYARLVPAARAMLRPAGTLLLELGAGQAPAVRALCAAHGFEGFAVADDLRGIPRVLRARRGAR